MSKTNKYKAHAYALSMWAEGTPEYRQAILAFNAGYRAGFLDYEKTRRLLCQAKKLLRQTFRLPQNKPWNILFPEGVSIRNGIEKFLEK